MATTRMERSAAHTTRSTTPRLLFRIGLWSALVLAALQAGYLFLVKDELGRVAANDILSAVSSLAAVLGMWYGARLTSRYNRRLGSAWWFFALAMAGWAVGDILWGYMELFAGEIPYPSIADAFYLSTYVLFFIGILRLPRQSGNSTSTAWLWLDVSVVMFSATGIYWNFLIGPALADHQQPWQAILVNSAYPLGDLLMICAITLAIFLPRSPLWLKPLYFIVAGFGLSAIADGIYSYQSLNQGFTSSSFFNIIFSIGPLVLMLGGLFQAVLVDRVMVAQKTVPLPQPTRWLALLRLTIPFVWLLFAYLAFYYGAISKQAFDPVQLSVWISIIIIGLTVRQILATTDNDRLAGELRTMNDSLEKRVAERTTDLLRTNVDLRREMEERQRIELMLREREEKLAHFALHDSLTGLPNRALVLDRISQAIQRHVRHPLDRFTVLFLDLDGLKLINDGLGHQAGDQLLIQFGQRLTSLVRAEDTVARLGGDEFVLLVDGFQAEGFPTVIANRVLDSLKEPFVVEGKSVYITASIGVALSDSSYRTAAEVLRDADLAMYEAKANGKARFVNFSPEMRGNAVDLLALDSDLHQALESNQFVLHYQPIVALESGRIVGLEALIRWQHPERGLIGPSEFISIAEASGFINPITRWTIQEACRQLATWRAELPKGFPLYVSVNLSPYSLRQPALADWVNEVLRSSNLSSHSLTFEIVETSLVQDSDRAKHFFTELRHLGVEVSLDDFGIGYSSLSYLDHYPIDVLKIDQSFTGRVTKVKEVDAIVRAVVTMASELGIKTIAEGIETQEQLDFMKQAGCQFGQGFLLSRPLDLQAACDLLRRQTGLPQIDLSSSVIRPEA